MSSHIKASSAEIAETVLLPGDPLRAKFITDNFLKNSFCYSKIRNTLGFTGYYRGKRISIQSTGMGIPSLMIYAQELISDYNCKNLIRIGTCGSFQPYLNINDIVIASSASSDSSIFSKYFGTNTFAPTADYSLLKKADNIASNLNSKYYIGQVFTGDLFYDDPEFWSLWKNFGVLAAEMETAGLYFLGSKFNVKTLSILTITDNILTNEKISTEKREKSLTDMIKLSLELAINA
ncbi:MAG: purine-nucleoside phosphorylase [Candidatus Cloacimonetes bacterium]|nr:purine-nucleoside phosphorylase [Candidatus Cloacimonadota bacterium]